MQGFRCTGDKKRDALEAGSKKLGAKPGSRTLTPTQLAEASELRDLPKKLLIVFIAKLEAAARDNYGLVPKYQHRGRRRVPSSSTKISVAKIRAEAERISERYGFAPFGDVARALGSRRHRDPVYLCLERMHKTFPEVMNELKIVKWQRTVMPFDIRATP